MPFGMPPGLRIPYDTDGTVGLIRRSAEYGGGLLDIHPNALKALNGEMTAGMVVPAANTSIPGTLIWGISDLYDVAGIGDMGVFFALFFPVPMNIRGIFLSTARSYSNGLYDGTGEPSSNIYATDFNRVEASKDSTNGLDGTWGLLDNSVRGLVPHTGVDRAGIDPLTGAARTATVTAGDRPVKNYYRNIYMNDGVGIRSVGGEVARNVRALKIYPLETDSIGTAAASTWGNFILHLYGEPDTNAFGQNFLQAWRSDYDMRLGEDTLSWGDVPLSSSGDKIFRLRNMSNLNTANSIVIDAFDGIDYPTGPAVSDQLLFSLDGGVNFFSSVTIGSLGPGTVSGNIILRRVTPANSPLTTYSPKIRFDVGSWS